MEGDGVCYFVPNRYGLFEINDDISDRQLDLLRRCFYGGYDHSLIGFAIDSIHIDSRHRQGEKRRMQLF
jgi:hypothetical protein